MTRDDAGRKPTKHELAAAATETVPDLVGPDLRVLFVGINPGLYSAATGHHFARPGNRFWKALHGAGFTPRELSPHEEEDLLPRGLGVTNLVARATAVASELRDEEIRAGAAELASKVARLRPACVAFLGVGAYRTAYGRPGATIGEQPERLEGARVWVLPNPSGLNAHYQLPALIDLFADLKRAVDLRASKR